MLKYVCNICGKSFDHHIKFRHHVNTVHNIGTKDYYDKYMKSENEGKCIICGKQTAFISHTKGYRECCSVSCANAQRNNIAMASGGTDVTCLVCNETLHSDNSLAKANTKLVRHLLAKHGIQDAKTYYDQYIKKDGEGICKHCGKPTEFKSIAYGYNTFCSAACSTSSAIAKEDGFVNTYRETKERASIFSKLVASIKEKYQKFISGGDKHMQYSDIRSDVIERNNVSDVKTIKDPENSENKITIKTEISCNPTYDWLGNQEYAPQLESCTSKPINRYRQMYNDIDDEQSFSSNEWC